MKGVIHIEARKGALWPQYNKDVSSWHSGFFSRAISPIRPWRTAGVGRKWCHDRHYTVSKIEPSCKIGKALEKPESFARPILNSSDA